MIKTLCWTKNWMLCEYLCFGLSPRVFPPQTERWQLEQTNFLYTRELFAFLLKVLLAYYYIYIKYPYSFPYIVNCTSICDCCIAISSPSITKQNYPHCHSSHSPTPIPITKNWCKSIFVWTVLCWQQLILKPTT